MWQKRVSWSPTPLIVGYSSASGRSASTGSQPSRYARGHGRRVADDVDVVVHDRGAGVEARARAHAAIASGVRGASGFPPLMAASMITGRLGIGHATQGSRRDRQHLGAPALLDQRARSRRARRGSRRR